MEREVALLYAGLFLTTLVFTAGFLPLDIFVPLVGLGFLVRFFMFARM